MTKRLTTTREITELEFVNAEDKKALLDALSVESIDAIKRPVVKVFETKNVKQVRLYLYDTSNWKYSLYMICDLVK